MRSFTGRLSGAGGAAFLADCFGNGGAELFEAGVPGGGVAGLFVGVCIEAYWSSVIGFETFEKEIGNGLTTVLWGCTTAARGLRSVRIKKRLAASS